MCVDVQKGGLWKWCGEIEMTGGNKSARLAVIRHTRK